MGADLELTWMLLVHLLLTGLPAAAAAHYAIHRGCTAEYLLLAIALAASGASAFLGFWAFYAEPTIGKSFAFLVIFGSIATIAWCWRAGVDRELARRLAVPFGLWALASAFVVYLGFVHGGTEEPLAAAANRFSHPLPGDNVIPSFFAEWFYFLGHEGTPPPYADWLSSDRPPLQIGYVLVQRPFGWDEEGLHYQVLGVVVQQLWVLGMWAVLSATRISPAARALAMTVTIVGDVAIVHGFFVWPKLISAAFALAALALVLSSAWERTRRDLRVAALFAALCAFSLLAHGAGIFFLIPVLGLAALRGVPSWRWLGVAALVAVVLFGSWSAYQRYADPPGDRLLKWQLGGSLEIDDRGAVETIVDGYREAGLDGTLRNKWENVREIVGYGDTKTTISAFVDYVEAGELGEAAKALRALRFFNLLPLLGILLLGPLAMLAQRLARGSPGGPEWSFALNALALCLAAAAVWALLLFGSPEARATVHVGSLALPLLAACACVVGAFAVSRRLAIGLVAINATGVLVLYAPALTTIEGTSYSPLAALLAFASLAGLLLLLYRDAARVER